MKTTHPEGEDLLTTYEPKTPLGRLILDVRARLKASGEPFLNEEELRREIADRRGTTDDE